MPVGNVDPPKEHKRRKFVSESKRLTLTYVVFFVWVSLAIVGMIFKQDLRDLAIYFTSGLPVILGYLWAESTHPSNPTGKDIANMVGNMNRGNQPNINNSPEPQQQAPQQQQPQFYQPQAVVQPQTITIYSDNNTSQLIISQSQLSTLMNTGYVSDMGGKYVYKGVSFEEIKQLIGGNNDPTI